VVADGLKARLALVCGGTRPQLDGGPDPGIPEGLGSVYHVREWEVFNQHYGDFCTGADRRHPM